MFFTSKVRNGASLQCKSSRHAEKTATEEHIMIRTLRKIQHALWTYDAQDDASKGANLSTATSLKWKPLTTQPGASKKPQINTTLHVGWGEMWEAETLQERTQLDSGHWCIWSCNLKVVHMVDERRHTGPRISTIECDPFLLFCWVLSHPDKSTQSCRSTNTNFKFQVSTKH